MMNRRVFLLSTLAPIAAGALAPRSLRAFSQDKPAAPSVPPIAYTCPMHAEVVEDTPGKCPLCGMTMVPVRLAYVWSCPVHSEVTKFEKGKCPIDHKDLVRVTKSVTFTCPVHKKVSELNPGKCPICKRTLVMRYSVRPHGNHNPQHGGYFFMASNNWHVEVNHPAAGLFHLYAYDEYSKPFFPPGLAGHIIEITDQSGNKKAVDIPFKKARAGRFLEARVPGLNLPANLAIKVRFEKNDKEYRFDFMFIEYSKDS